MQVLKFLNNNLKCLPEALMVEVDFLLNYYSNKFDLENNLMHISMLYEKYMLSIN